ncbi:MAG: hypothetical protein KGL39_24190 [Patescibacteria group bacterium]|nr:hypothetical protein [Patescibacteria group bacterium]
MTRITRAPACRDCLHCTLTPRGKGNHTYTCGHFKMDCYAARMGEDACGLDGTQWAPRSGLPSSASVTKVSAA